MISGSFWNKDDWNNKTSISINGGQVTVDGKVLRMEDKAEEKARIAILNAYGEFEYALNKATGHLPQFDQVLKFVTDNFGDVQKTKKKLKLKDYWFERYSTFTLVNGKYEFVGIFEYVSEMEGKHNHDDLIFISFGTRGGARLEYRMKKDESGNRHLYYYSDGKEELCW